MSIDKIPNDTINIAIEQGTPVKQAIKKIEKQWEKNLLEIAERYRKGIHQVIAERGGNLDTKAKTLRLIDRTYINSIKSLEESRDRTIEGVMDVIDKPF